MDNIRSYILWLFGKRNNRILSIIDQFINEVSEVRDTDSLVNIILQDSICSEDSGVVKIFFNLESSILM